MADDGTAEVPEDDALAGWFREGGRPGGRGPTVLLGHLDSRDGPAVIFRLRERNPGDVIEIVTGDGETVRYAVDRTDQVPKDEFPTFAVFGATADDVLRLVPARATSTAGSAADNPLVNTRRVQFRGRGL